MRVEVTDDDTGTHATSVAVYLLSDSAPVPDTFSLAANPAGVDKVIVFALAGNDTINLSPSASPSRSTAGRATTRSPAARAATTCSAATAVGSTA